eukprot:CAMPEP_0184749376 /NCGR_PEP_ID=MMETSP0315-20130426/27637_1 /TAXON_ID=101924 /ORGANISM="Rhodosorus marinus, Strain UTEX LB 2760" /LENGTH=218 /DNA_ID=CAMNT_0027226257 /DNA_START=426 /DNA_END=1078 /DNA_ORIENTATION=+
MAKCSLRFELKSDRMDSSTTLTISLGGLALKEKPLSGSRVVNLKPKRVQQRSFYVPLNPRVESLVAIDFVTQNGSFHVFQVDSDLVCSARLKRDLKQGRHVACVRANVIELSRSRPSAVRLGDDSHLRPTGGMSSNRLVDPHRYGSPAEGIPASHGEVALLYCSQAKLVLKFPRSRWGPCNNDNARRALVQSMNYTRTYFIRMSLQEASFIAKRQRVY